MIIGQQSAGDPVHEAGDVHEAVGLERHPKPGEMPSDVDVQAERQQEGMEEEFEEAAVEQRRRAEAEHIHDEPGVP